MNTTTSSRPWADLASIPAPRRWPDRHSPSDMAWAAAGYDWDAIALDMDEGLAALDRGALRPEDVPVVVDYHLRRVYILVQRGTAATCAGRARVLTRGAQILMPRHSSHVRAAWLTDPDTSRLPDASRLVGALERPG